MSEFFNTDFGVLCYYARNTLLMDSGKISNKQGTWEFKNCATVEFICDVGCNSSAITLVSQRNVWLFSKKVLLCPINFGYILRNFSLGVIAVFLTGA